jgi:hypothetical protein
MPDENTLAALPLENPPPMNDAERVQKITSQP